MPLTFRTRFKKEIVAEFLPPLRPTKHQRVVIICDGAPSVPSKRDLLQFFSHKGFWVIHPRYRGTWESDGIFLRKPLDQDAIDIIDSLPHGFISFWDNKKYRVRPDEIYIVAGSFGSPAGILASRDSRVTKVVCISPVVDWRAPSKAEPLGWFFKFLKNGFGNGYRFTPRETKKLMSGKFYNPVRHISEIDGSKLLIFHARDDKSVRWNEVAKFARATDATLKLFKHGGHLSSKKIIPKYWKQILKFFKTP